MAGGYPHRCPASVWLSGEVRRRTPLRVPSLECQTHHRRISHGRNQLWGHCVRPHVGGARRADDPRPRVLLRRPRPPQELPGDHDAELHQHGRRDVHLGRGAATRWRSRERPRGLIGNLDWAFLHGVGETPGPWAPTIPALAHFVYQEMFAIITPALITGAFADRVNFKSYLWFLVCLELLVYIPFTHWIWGGGFLAEWGVLDFAGGMVVHVSAGMAALASVWVVGRAQVRQGRTQRAAQHRLRGARDRACCGSAGSGSTAAPRWPPTASPPRPSSTPTSPARSRCAPGCSSPGGVDGKPSLVGAFTGAVAGLACVTPCAGYIPTWSAFIVGLAGRLASATSRSSSRSA